MTTETHHIIVSGIKVEVVRKDIKNLHLGVYPPQGRVRVAAPMVISDEAIRLAVIDKLTWINRQKAKFDQQPRQSQREMVNGESHYYLGRRYRLRVHEVESIPRVLISGVSMIDLFVRPKLNPIQREVILQKWYREQLRKIITDHITKWQPILDVQLSSWGIKKMKTKWGSCNSSTRIAWFNLELAKVDEKCIEYIVVHELMHLKERSHSARYVALLDHFITDWKSIRDRINKHPLGTL